MALFFFFFIRLGRRRPPRSTFRSSPALLSSQTFAPAFPMPLASAARALSGAAASTSGASIAGSASCLVAGRRAARPPPIRSPASATAAASAASAVATRPRPRRRERLLIVSASSSASSSNSSSSQPPPPQLFGPPPFDPAKLTVTRLPGVEEKESSSGSSRTGNGTAKATSNPSSSSSSPPPPAAPLFPLPRRYTLTHNDVTGALALSIGPDYNSAQLEGWYVRMIRDEVLAEWRLEGDDEKKGRKKKVEGSDESDENKSNSGGPSGHSLHVFCHVSGDARWLAPPRLRSRIFQREMALVLDTISHADAALLRANPGLTQASVVVHLRSHVASLDARLVWGILGDRRGWREPPRLLEGLLEGGKRKRSVFFFKRGRREVESEETGETKKLTFSLSLPEKKPPNQSSPTSGASSEAVQSFARTLSPRTRTAATSTASASRRAHLRRRPSFFTQTATATALLPLLPLLPLPPPPAGQRPSTTRRWRR